MNDALFLDILNLTVGDDGTTATGFDPTEIFLTVQGRIGTGDGPYAHLDWSTGNLKAMALADNTEVVHKLGVDPTITYAKYWITLADLMTKSYFDTTNGLAIPTPIYSGRLYISFSDPVYIQVVFSDDNVISPAEPDEGNETDPNFMTIWDKFEFTANTDDILFSNTTAVDFVGIPMAYSVNGSNTAEQGFELDANAQKDPFEILTKSFKNDADFSVLVGTSRLFAPKVNAAEFAPFGNAATYMDPYIKFCWAHYQANTKPIEIWNFVDVTMADNTSLSSDDNGKGCKWEASGVLKGGNAAGTTGTLAFTITKLTDKNGTALTPPTTVFTIPLPNSWDVLRQGGVFAPDKSLSGYLKIIDGDIKNQVSSALNRNVMHGSFTGNFDDTNPNKGLIFWADRDAYYEDNGVPTASLCINKYGKFLHELSIDNLCYALAYDDKYSQNVNLTAKLNSTTPTVMKLMVYYKKLVVANGNFPLASMKVNDLENNSYTIDLKNDPNANNAVLLSVTPATNKIMKCVVLFPRNDADNQMLSKYFPGHTTNNQISIPASFLVGGFRFAFRFEIIGDSIPGRGILLPQDADHPNGTVLMYDFTNTTTPLSVVSISNI